MLKTIVAGRGGWFCRADARACGYTEFEIRDRLRSGRWLRLCRDGYVEAAAESPPEPAWQRRERVHRLTAAAVLHRMSGDAVVSHQSAVLLHHLPVWNLPLDRVHVTRPVGRWRSTTELVVHRARIDPSDITVVDGVRVTNPARAVVEAACLSSYEAGVVLCDAVLREGLAAKPDLEHFVRTLRHRAGAPRAANAVAFADARSESVGESRLRALIADHRLPTPVLQAELSHRGQFVARVDFMFRAERIVVEFDGESKYGSAGDLVAEKWREDRIRALGYAVIRLGWSDLERPVHTTRRIADALARRAACCCPAQAVAALDNACTVQGNRKLCSDAGA